MFSKNNTYLQQLATHHQVSSSSLHNVVDLNNVEILLHHHHPDMFSGHFLPANVPPPQMEAAALLTHHQGGGGSGGGNGDYHQNSVQRKTATTVKKDRHSKIFTSQGPRDRRVRLSIGIARKFFDLQEMLGFDKPSKTLDWLLNKSKAAIKDLMQSKASTSSLSSSEEKDNNSSLTGAAAAADSKRAKAKNDPSKESRAKARARARERTREKMSIKHLNTNNTMPQGSQYSNIHHSILPNVDDLYTNNNNNKYNEVEVFQLSSVVAGSTSKPNVDANFREPIIPHATYEPVIKRKVKNPSVFGFHQNAAIVSRDHSSSNYINIPSANAGENNWDICAILDHHKFINSNSNI